MESADSRSARFEPVEPVESVEPAEPLGHRMARRPASRRSLAILFVLLAATAWSYRGNLELGFTDADALAHVAAARVDDLGDLARQVWQPLTAGVAENNAAFWRPVTMLQFAFLRALFGWDPFGWQIWGLGLHLVVVALVFGMMRAARRTDGEALVAAGIVALHPLAVEIVPAVARGNDSLSALLCIATLGAVSSGRIRWAALLGLLAMGSKEPVVAVLPVLVLWAAALGDRRGARTLALVWGIAVPLYLAGRAAVLGGWGGYGDAGPTFFVRHFGRTLTAVPLELLFPGWTPQIEARVPESVGLYLSSLLLVIAIVAAISAWRRGNRVPMLGLALVIVPLVLLGITGTYTRRQVYLPTAGLAIGLAALLGHRQLRWVLAAWIATLLPASPLIHRDNDWRLSDDINTALTEGAADELRSLPHGAILWVLDRPIRVDNDPRRRMLWRKGMSVNNTLAHYSFDVWLDDRLDRADIDLRFVAQPLNVSSLDQPVVVVGDGAIRVKRQPIERRWGRRIEGNWLVETNGDETQLRRVNGQPNEWLLVAGTPRAILVEVP